MGLSRGCEDEDAMPRETMAMQCQERVNGVGQQTFVWGCEDEDAMPRETMAMQCQEGVNGVEQGMRG